ncbi:DUF6461 domain-containing protein [Nocardia alni]|uniref:DUF6461 domain-containing protein n=1 Tax=Nocardia alni TaxID=2815723 RepID=UPI001C21840C|nr:DUF6461 domain-containing protein [Nocardia alni]
MLSPSGEWSLRYDADGRAVIADRDGTVTWSAGAAGTLCLGQEGIFAVYQGNEVLWRADLPELRWSTLHVTNDGDGIISEAAMPVYSLLHGPIVPESLGERAPVAQIRGNRVLMSDDGKYTVNRSADGESLVSTSKRTGGYWSIKPVDARSLDQADTWLTWRFPRRGPEGSELVLVGPGDDVRWEFGLGHVEQPATGVSAAPDENDEDGEDGEENGDRPPWMEEGLGAMDGGYCLTVIHDVDPDEALRRLGADDSQIATATWAELQRRVSDESAYDSQVVAAFGLGPHALLVEDGGDQGATRPELSRGTFAVSCHFSVNADQTFLVSRDGETLATFNDGALSGAWGAEPGVIEQALAAMGIDDPDAFDDGFLDDIELLCQVAGIRPTVADVTGAARVILLGA